MDEVHAGSPSDQSLTSVIQNRDCGAGDVGWSASSMTAHKNFLLLITVSSKWGRRAEWNASSSSCARSEFCKSSGNIWPERKSCCQLKCLYTYLDVFDVLSKCRSCMWRSRKTNYFGENVQNTETLAVLSPDGFVNRLIIDVYNCGSGIVVEVLKIDEVIWWWEWSSTYLVHWVYSLSLLL